MVKRVEVIVKGKPSYERWSIYQWILEYRDILENEYNVSINVSIRDGDEEYPVIIVDDQVIHKPPFEEGYIVEALKKILDKYLEKQ